jgi:hypothetical protein
MILAVLRRIAPTRSLLPPAGGEARFGGCVPRDNGRASRRPSRLAAFMELRAGCGGAAARVARHLQRSRASARSGSLVPILVRNATDRGRAAQTTDMAVLRRASLWLRASPPR